MALLNDAKLVGERDASRRIEDAKEDVKTAQLRLLPSHYVFTIVLKNRTAVRLPFLSNNQQAAL
jgi:hypothetical protein